MHFPVTIAYIGDRIELCHHMRVLITSVMETLKRHVLNISNMNRFINVVSARENLNTVLDLKLLLYWPRVRHGWPGQDCW